MPIACAAVQLHGSTALLTGASGGLGQAIAHALDAAGARVLLSGRRAERLEEVRAGSAMAPTCLPADLAERGAAADWPGGPATWTCWWRTPGSPGAGGSTASRRRRSTARST